MSDADAEKALLKILQSIYFYNKRNIDDIGEETKTSLSMLFRDIFVYMIISNITIILFIAILPFFPKKWMIILVSVILILVLSVGIYYCSELVKSDLGILQNGIDRAFKPYTSWEFTEYIAGCTFDVGNNVYSCPPYT